MNNLGAGKSKVRDCTGSAPCLRAARKMERTHVCGLEQEQSEPVSTQWPHDIEIDPLRGLALGISSFVTGSTSQPCCNWGFKFPEHESGEHPVMTVYIKLLGIE